MKQLILILLSSIVLYSCSKKENFTTENKIKDTIIAKTENNNDTYSRIIRYNLVIAGDTSKTGIIFYQNSEGKLHLGLGLGKTSQRHYKETKPYRLRYLEVKKLMEYAAQDLDTKSLKDVGIGWLMETGDLAIHVSQDYFKRYGNPGNINWNQIGPKKREQIYEILIASRTGKDINALLVPFGKKIDQVTRAEQLMFTPKSALDYYTTYETVPSEIPEFILDAGIDFSVVDK